MISTEWYSGYDDLSDAYAVRNEVFMKELGVMDDPADKDDLNAMILVIYEDGVPVATGRALLEDDNFTLGLIATLAPNRGRGYGDFLLRLLIRRCFLSGGTLQYADTPKSAVPFFKRLGFRIMEESSPGREYLRLVRTGDINE